MFKKIILILVILFSFVNIVNASSKYKFICDNNVCNNTTRDFISDNYYLYNVNYQNINNFSNFIDGKLNEYKDYYGDAKFKINGYCEGDCSIIENKEFDLNGIISLNKEFHIGSKSFFWFMDNKIEITYNSGLDFLFSNFSLVINDLHNGFPIGDKKPNLNDILKNILSYNSIDNKFNVKNVCVDEICNESKLLKIGYDNINNYTLVSGNIKQSTSFKYDTFKVSNNYNISKLLLKAGESINFNFGFEDYLEFIDDNTQYEYRIYYNYEGEGLPNYEDYFLKETILINNNTFVASSPNISNDIIGSLIDVKVLDSDDKKIRVGVKEGINLPKAGKINFYLAVKNISSGDEFALKQINLIPVTVLPNDNIYSGVSNITSPFTPEINSANAGFNANAPFNVSISLFDAYLNKHFDTIDGYDVSLSPGTSEFFEISKGAYDYGKTISGIKTDNTNSINFNFRITESGYHNFNGFNIRIKGKIDPNNYASPIIYYYINNIIPSNLYNGSQKMKIYIKAPILSQLPVTCGRTVSVNFKCTSDNFSGCNALGNTTNTYDKQSQNGTYSYVTIIDQAYNRAVYYYTMNHVDRTAPVVTFLKGSSLLNSNDYTDIANSDDLKLKFYEWTTESCTAEVNYIVKVNGSTIKNGLLNGASTELTIPDFFKKSGIKNLYVKATDKYGNFSEKNIKFTLNPDFVSENNTKIDLIGGIKNSKYANNFDEYEYKITLLDKYLNPIYNKKILFLDTDCSSFTGCKNIKTILGNSGNDALIEIYSNLLTNPNGEVSFKLKSLAPGVFTEIFKITLSDWNSNYNDINNQKTFSVGKFSDLNLFKSPVAGSISIVEGGTKPEIGKKQKYKISLTKENNNNLVLNNDSNGNLDISKSTIDHKTQGHFWNTFGGIDSFFGNDLNNFLGFSGSIDANTNILEGVNIITNNLSISYKIGGEIVKYYLSNFGFSGCDTSTLGLKVIGTLQGDGKSDITGQDKNFSDLSKFLSRTSIRTNGYKLIKGQESGKIINGVKYIEGNIDVSGDLPYETLIVKNGNVIISGDLNPSNKKLGIIVLKDNYLVASDYNKTGNIYVDKDVKKINAIIYSDGAFRSADSYGQSFSDMELGTKLELNGTLFTRNTIGGAITAGGKYLLPGGRETTNYELAEIYDLNFTRKIKDACGEPSFIIKYNSSVQSNPPIGF